MAAREHMFENSSRIVFIGPKALHRRVKAYAKAQGKYIGVAYTELILKGLERKQKDKQLDLPLE